MSFKFLFAGRKNRPETQDIAADPAVRWKNLTAQADKMCRRLPLSKTLEHISALCLLFGSVSTNELKHMTDCTLSTDKLAEIIGNTGLMRVSGGKIYPSYEPDAIITDGNKAGEVLIYGIVNGLFAAETLMNISRLVVHSNYFEDKKAFPFDIDVERLLKALETDAALEKLAEIKKLHRIRIAGLYSTIAAVKASGGNDAEARISRAVEASFIAIMNEVSESEPSYKLKVWGKYLNVVIAEQLNMPKAMLDFITDENFRQVTEYIKNYHVSAKRKEKDQKIISAVRNCAAEIYRRVHETAPYDMVSVLLLAGVCTESGKYAEARETLAAALTGEQRTSFNAMTAVIKTYELEIKEMKSARAAFPRSSERFEALTDSIKELGAVLDRTCFEYEQRLMDLIIEEFDRDKLKEIETAYITIVAKHARICKEAHHYGTCFELLTGVPENFPRMEAIYLELAMLYQNRGCNFRTNTHYSPEKAAATFEQAMSEAEKNCADERNFGRTAASILIPLAYTYESLGSRDMTIATLQRLLGIDPKQKQAIEFMERIRGN